MKKLLKGIGIVFLGLILIVGLFSCGGESESKTDNQGTESVSKEETNLGDFKVEIDSCRFAKDYEGKDVIIVKYLFTNVSYDESAAFWMTMTDNAYQNGIGLNPSYVLADSADYSGEDQEMKEIKQGATLEVEQAYELDDMETPVEIEVGETWTFDDSKVTKTFEIN